MRNYFPSQHIDVIDYNVIGPFEDDFITLPRVLIHSTIYLMQGTLPETVVTITNEVPCTQKTHIPVRKTVMK
jgi:hypothetical protein